MYFGQDLETYKTLLKEVPESLSIGCSSYATALLDFQFVRCLVVHLRDRYDEMEDEDEEADK